jgi:pimeloyl-ACP methyl ester carboxylesterase
MTRLTCAFLAALACVGSLAALGAAPASDLITVDHYVRMKSDVPAMAGQVAQLYVRERANPAVLLRSASLADRVVLFVHGAGTPAEVAFDVPHAGYSWMAYLAEDGFDVFSMDLTGYGRSTRPSPMDDPCNLSREQQSTLVPVLLAAPCAPTYAKPLTSMATDWDEIAAVIEYVRALRRVDRVALVAWSRGGPRVGGYAVRNPAAVSRLVLLAPAYNRAVTAADAEAAPAAGAAMNTQSRREFTANWDRQVGCSDQYDPVVADAVWTEMLRSDPLGATWGPGVRRAPQSSGTWTQAVVRKLAVPTLMVTGVHDRQVLPERVRHLYEDLGATEKVFVDLGCSSHNAMWEKNRLLLFEASRTWLASGTVNGVKQGTIRLGYPSTAGTPTN